MHRLLALSLILWLPLACSVQALLGAESAPPIHDLVIYGNTSAGVIAAVQARKMGRTVVLVGPERHLGGLSSGGLGWTDSGDKSVIGGLARNFYHRIWLQYQEPGAWRHEARETFGNKGQGTVAMDATERTMWIFEPSVAERVFEEYAREFGF